MDNRCSRDEREERSDERGARYAVRRVDFLSARPPGARFEFSRFYVYVLLKDREV